VLVRWRASPVNPADINQIQGVYPVKPPLPAVAGNEACGVVEMVSESITQIHIVDEPTIDKNSKLSK
jgi:mitochondrial enoyl-[acyl-carrier protein] reductase / trans-2-enoyl-CoA reductase